LNVSGLNPTLQFDSSAIMTRLWFSTSAGSIEAVLFYYSGSQLIVETGLIASNQTKQAILIGQVKDVVVFRNATQQGSFTSCGSGAFPFST
jgi:hypothetical protein